MQADVPEIADSRSRGRARIGIITPFTNTNLEADIALLRPDGVSCHVMRAGGYDLDAVPDSEQMRKFALAGLDDVLAMLLPAKPDIVLYGCTSATLSMGPDYDRNFCAMIEDKSGVPAVTAAGALVEALNDLDARTIGFCSPYTEELNRESAAFLGASGRQVIQSAYVGEDLDSDGQNALTPPVVFDLGLRADHPQADAIVMSCTDMRAVEVITALESRTGKPVVTSNQALFHVANKRLGLNNRVMGRLGETGTPVLSGARQP
ncbi:MAG: Asp/Glu racemase [Rhodospirillales bacterium]|nr:Asp/Glu racemase [Rhodospirillales bacterium]